MSPRISLNYFVSFRNRRASEGDNWTEVKSGPQSSGVRRGGGRHSSGGQGGVASVPAYRGRHSAEEGGRSFSGSFQVSGGGGGVSVVMALGGEVNLNIKS